MPPWRRVDITEKKIAEERDGVVLLKFALSHPVPDPWLTMFAQAGGGRSGSNTYLNGPGPQPYEQWIEWSVPQDDMEDAVRHVRARVETTNREMSQYVDEAERLIREADAPKEAEKARLKALQDRLDQM